MYFAYPPTHTGIIPGAETEFEAFISESLGTDKPSLYLGLLQSAFIVGFSLAALAFGHAVHYCHPFRMVGVGISIWVVATFFSGLAHAAGSYQFLFFARMLSGVGEASFQVGAFVRIGVELGTCSHGIRLEVP